MRFVIPEVVISHFHIREGDVVADFGAGSGYFLEPLTQAVGEDGVVYAVEIQKSLVETITRIAKEKNLPNVRPLWGDLERLGGSKVPEAGVDVVIMVNTFFQTEDKSAVVSEIARIIRPGGKVIVIDWSESWNGLGPAPAQVITADETKMLFEGQGYSFEADFDAGDHHYGLTFRK